MHFVDFLNELQKKIDELQKEVGKERFSDDEDVGKIFWLRQRLEIVEDLRDFYMSHRNWCIIKYKVGGLDSWSFVEVK